MTTDDLEAMVESLGVVRSRVTLLARTAPRLTQSQVSYIQDFVRDYGSVTSGVSNRDSTHRFPHYAYLRHYSSQAIGSNVW